MFKKLIAAALGLFVAAAFAASVDANKATQAELESIKGVGPGISSKIVDERKNGAFKDWNDLVTRVKGVGDGNAAKLSADGLTVNGAAFKPTAATPAMKKDEMKADKAAAKAEKAAMKADDKMKATTPATPAKPAMPASAAMPAKKTADAAPMSAKPASATMTAAKPMAPAPKASEPMKK